MTNIKSLILVLPHKYSSVFLCVLKPLLSTAFGIFCCSQFLLVAGSRRKQLTFNRKNDNPIQLRLESSAPARVGLEITTSVLTGLGDYSSNYLDHSAWPRPYLQLWKAGLPKLHINTKYQWFINSSTVILIYNKLQHKH